MELLCFLMVMFAVDVSGDDFKRFDKVVPPAFEKVFGGTTDVVLSSIGKDDEYTGKMSAASAYMTGVDVGKPEITPTDAYRKYDWKCTILHIDLKDFVYGGNSPQNVRLSIYPEVTLSLAKTIEGFSVNVEGEFEVKNSLDKPDYKDLTNFLRAVMYTALYDVYAEAYDVLLDTTEEWIIEQ